MKKTMRWEKETLQHSLKQQALKMAIFDKVLENVHVK